MNDLLETQSQLAMEQPVSPVKQIDNAQRYEKAIGNLREILSGIDTVKCGGTTVAETEMLNFISKLHQRWEKKSGPVDDDATANKIIMQSVTVSALKIAGMTGVTDEIKNCLSKYCSGQDSLDDLRESLIGEESNIRHATERYLQEMMDVAMRMEEYSGVENDDNWRDGFIAETWGIIERMVDAYCQWAEREIQSSTDQDLYGNLSRFMVGIGEDISAIVVGRILSLNPQLCVISSAFMVDENGEPRADDEIYAEWMEAILDVDLREEDKIDLMRLMMSHRLSGVIDDLDEEFLSGEKMLIEVEGGFQGISNQSYSDLTGLVKSQVGAIVGQSGSTLQLAKGNKFIGSCDPGVLEKSGGKRNAVIDHKEVSWWEIGDLGELTGGKPLAPEFIEEIIRWNGENPDSPIEVEQINISDPESIGTRFVDGNVETGLPFKIVNYKAPGESLYFDIRGLKLSDTQGYLRSLLDGVSEDFQIYASNTAGTKVAVTLNLPLNKAEAKAKKARLEEILDLIREEGVPIFGNNADGSRYLQASIKADKINYYDNWHQITLVGNELIEDSGIEVLGELKVVLKSNGWRMRAPSIVDRATSVTIHVEEIEDFPNERIHPLQLIHWHFLESRRKVELA